jgi:hypothetical protein
MFKRKGDRIKYIVTTILLVLCFLFITTIFQNSIKPVKVGFQFQIASLHSNAIAPNDIQQPSFRQISLLLVNELNFKLFNQHIKLLTDNRLINQRYLFLQKAEILIEPIVSLRFYSHYLYIDPEEPPILS